MDSTLSLTVLAQAGVRSQVLLHFIQLKQEILTIKEIRYGRE